MYIFCVPRNHSSCKTTPTQHETPGGSRDDSGKLSGKSGPTPKQAAQTAMNMPDMQCDAREGKRALLSGHGLSLAMPAGVTC